MPQTLSIVIPVRNDAARLGRCLSSIAAQPRQDVAVFVVDDASRPEEREAAWHACARTGARLMDNAGRGRSAARNTGLAAVRSEGVLFVDSDQELEPGLLAACVAALDVADVASIIEDNVPRSFWSRVQFHEFRMWFHGTGRDIPRLYRTEWVRRAGAWAEDLEFGEDWDLAQRVRALGAREILLGRPGLLHHGTASFGGVVRKYFHYGRHLRRLLARHGRQAMTMYAPAGGRVLRTVARYLVRHPGWGSAALFLRAVRFAAAGAGWLSAWVVPPRRPVAPATTPASRPG